MNDVKLIGRLTADPELRYTTDEKPRATFSLAVDRPHTKDKTDFPRIVVFGNLAETVARYLTKGRMVAVDGSVQTGSYTNRDGQKVYTTDIVADSVEFLDKPKQDNGWGDL